MIDWSKPIQTADKWKARLLGNLKTITGDDKTRAVALEDPEGSEMAYTVFENGRYYRDRESFRDIINVPPRKVMREVEVWAVVDSDGAILTYHDTRERTSTSWVLKRDGTRVVRLTGTVEVEVKE